jgi:hypothetical protein
MLTCSTGLVNENNTVLRYGPRETAEDYFHPDFEPIFLDEMDTNEKRTKNSVCADDRACQYDLFASGSVTFALGTRDARELALKDNSDVSK